MPYFTGSQGRIFHDSWLPTGTARSAIVLLHGYGEHLGLYEAFARRLVADGHAVYALDAVGHGRSDGDRAVIASWDHYIEDTQTLTALAAAAHPGIPIILAGHSAGAVAATLLATRSPGIASGLILSGAPLRRLAWVDAELAAGEAETEAGDPTELLSTHPEYVAALLHDPLTWKGGFRRETLLAITTTWPEVAAALSDRQPDLPVLFVHGESDPVVPVDDSYWAMMQLPQAQIRVFPGDLHDVLNELNRDEVHEEIAAFVNETVLSQTHVSNRSLAASTL